MPSSPYHPLLVMDPEPRSRLGLRLVLEDAGFLVDESVDQHDVWELLTVTGNPAFLPCGLIMQAGSHWSSDVGFVRVIDQKLPSLPIIIMIPAPCSQLERFALRRGQTTVLEKPFDDVRLVECVCLLLPTHATDTASRLATNPSRTQCARKEP